jgi:subtilisin family serine protease
MRSSTLSPRVRRGIAFTIALLVGAFALQSAVAGNRAPTPTEAPDSSQDRLLVKFDRGVATSARSRVIAAAGGTAVGRIAGIDVNLVEGPASELAAVQRRLRTSAVVRFVEVDAKVHAFDTVPNDYWWPSEWAPVKTRTSKAWDLTTGSSGVVVAVLDTGVDAAHPDLQGALVAGRDVVNNDADPSDDQGHGTFVAGVVGARSNNSIGVASYCWRCSIMSVKVLGSDGAGSLSNVTSGVVWATDHGARVVNMSLGGTSASSTLASAVKYAHDRGVVLVASAGNYGTSTKVYPAAYPEVLGVAGTDSTDKLYSWSSFGSWVSVAAPGFNWSTARGGGYGEFAGTSSAAPVVAGIAGLAAAFSPAATNAQIESAIKGAATPIGTVVSAGRVDTYGTLVALGGSTGSAPASVDAPTISGALQDGLTVTASTGSWNGSDPLAYAYQWQRCDSAGAGCSGLSGATASSYVATPADVGGTLRVALTASNPYGSSTATSAATAIVAPAPTAPPGTGTATASFSGSLNRKQPSRAYPLTVGSGMAHATLAFAKSPSLSLTVQRADGSVVGSASGASVLPLIASLSAGDYSYVVSGGNANTSFTLTVTYATP